MHRCAGFYILPNDVEYRLELILALGNESIDTCLEIYKRLGIGSLKPEELLG
mgnify:CR=1 FL=1